MPPRAPLALSVTAITMVQSARAARLIQILRPFSTQWPPSRSARVVIMAGSPPAPGSEMAMADTVSPRAYGSR
ncbi:hypothetical protein D9M69_190040 [compost metagenome]